MQGWDHIVYDTLERKKIFAAAAAASPNMEHRYYLTYRDGSLQFFHTRQSSRTVALHYDGRAFFRPSSPALDSVNTAVKERKKIQDGYDASLPLPRLTGINALRTGMGPFQMKRRWVGILESWHCQHLH